ncbi:MAG TPA: C25 family cysteine peptidase, partial [Chitinivibrionales bacterium]
GRATHGAVNLPAIPFGKGVALEVDHDGIYQITGAQLQRLGVPLASIPSKLLRLFCKNNEVPIYITNAHHANVQSGDTILFYGTMLRGAAGRPTQFSNTNIYWLTWDGNRPGMRIAEVSGALRRDARKYEQNQQQKQLAARDFMDTLHLEEDNDIRWLGGIDIVSDIGASPDTADTLDNWYWGIIGENYTTPFTITVPSPSANLSAKARLRIGLMGLSSTTGVATDHNLAVTLNDNPLGDSLMRFGWKGQTPYIYVSAPFPQSRLKVGANVISFLCQSSFTDMTALNWVDIAYLRTFTACNDQLWFASNPLDTGAVYEFDVSGFSSSALDVWDIGSNRLFTDFEIQKTAGGSSPSFTLILQDSLTSVRSYFTQTTAKRLQPARMRLDTLKTNWDTLVNADYLIVTVDSFAAALQPLTDAYRKKGMTVAVVDVNDVYNTFSAGIHDPESIRSFIRRLFSLAVKKFPKYLLLGGDTTHDLDKNRRERNIVPTHLSRVPGWGPSSNDGYFAMADNDNFPSLFVGRFPAENKNDMRILVQKTVRYISNPQTGFWRDNMLLLGGWENDFTNFNATVSSQVIGSNMHTYRLDADTGSPFYKNEFTASKTITDYINAGVYALNFNGHGGGNIWSDSKFFGYNDLDNLYNGQWGKGGKLPFVFSFTCLTGFFESAFYRSLGEEFIRRNENGALCFFGASAYTSKQANLIMNRILIDRAVNGQPQSIGELIGYTKMEMLARYGELYLPVLRQYNLLGDPALPWSLAPDSLTLTLPDTSLDNIDSLAVSGACPTLQTGQARIVITADGKNWDNRIVGISKNALAETVPMKDSVRTVSGLVHAYAWNDSQQARGSLTFSKSALSVRDVALSKRPARFGDTVAVSCSFVLPAQAAGGAMLCLYGLSPLPPTASQSVFSSSASMRQTSGSGWISGPIPLVFSGKIGDMLFVRFRMTYAKNGVAMSDTSGVYSFSLEGRPDLVFTDDTLRPHWDGDSLRIDFQALNAGNAAAGAMRVMLFKGASGLGDTLGIINNPDSMRPGTRKNFSVAIPDTQGAIAITVRLNADRAFPEISFDNNTKTARFTLSYADISLASDSLYSPGKGLCLTAPAGLRKKSRVFLFGSTSVPRKPLNTESSWTPLIGDSVTRFSIGVRPILSQGDSLAWIFFKDTSLVTHAAVASGKTTVLTLDSTLGVWRSACANTVQSAGAVVMRSPRTGPFCLGFLSDTKPPEIRASVNGRELVFLDYAAKDKPFNMRLRDASGIAPSSIVIRINGKIMDSGSVSRPVAAQTGLTDLTVTAYPKKQFAVDSLSVYAEDLAGNAATTVFAYMPGEDLRIKFLSCHPNPFTAAQNARGATMQTIRLAFLITDVARDVTLTVCTIGGKTVWKWQKSGGVIGYQEVEWDGKTADGHRLANGTYYAKLVAINDSKKVSKIIRIAKLEGY